jgi:hypothetical protein
MAEGSRTGTAMAILAGLAAAVLAGWLWMPRTPTLPSTAPSAGASGHARDRAAGATGAPAAGPAPSAPGAPGAAPAPWGPDEAKARLAAMGDPGLALVGNPAMAGGPVPDPVGAMTTAADGALSRLDAALEDAAQAGQWGDDDRDKANRIADRVEADVRTLQARFADGDLSLAEAIRQVEQTVMNGGAAIGKAVGQPGTVDPRPAAPEQDIEDAWGGISFEEWAKQVEAEQRAGR